MYAYVVTIALAWAVCMLFGHVWRMKVKRQLFRGVPDMPGQHWFWGYIHVVKNFDDLVKMAGDYIAEAAPPSFTTWMMFFFPVLNPLHPDSLKTVLTANNLPKNGGLFGAYRLAVPWLGDGLVVSAGKKWERNRRLLTPAFHFGILRTYIPMFNHVSDIFVTRVREAAAGGQSIDVYPMVSRATLDTMLRSTLSYEDDTVQNGESYHPYVAAVTKLAHLLAERAMSPHCFFDFVYFRTAKGREMKKTTDYVHEFASQIIQARQRALEEDPDRLERKKHLDFLDTLLTAKDEDGNGLTNQEIRDEVDTFMFAGHDTTASAISWALHALAKHPTMQQQLREEAERVFNGRQHLNADDLSELRYTTYFLKEVLRFYSPVPLTQRKTIQPLTVQGITFQPGQQIDVHHYLIHHNPAVWDNPGEFRPERFYLDNAVKQDPFAYVPFSAGPRNCIGQNFAMNEMKIFISKMVHRFRIVPDPDREAVLFAEVVMRPKDGIYLRFEEI